MTLFKNTTELVGKLKGKRFGVLTSFTKVLKFSPEINRTVLASGF